MKKLEEQIKKINNLDCDIVSKTLLASSELFWGLNRIIEKELFTDKIGVGDTISDYYINVYGFLNEDVSSKLLNYLGFEENDEVADEIITDYCMEEENSKDINILRGRLTEWAMELVELEKNGL